MAMTMATVIGSRTRLTPSLIAPQHRLFRLLCCRPRARSMPLGRVTTDSSAPEIAKTETVSHLPVPKPRGISSSTSILTSENIRKALIGEGIGTVDHYKILRVPRGASYSEVEKAFQDRCQEVKQHGMDEDLEKCQLQALKDSFEILTSDEQRRLYDWSLVQTEKGKGSYIWPYESDITQKSSASAPPMVPYGNSTHCTMHTMGEEYPRLCREDDADTGTLVLQNMDIEFEMKQETKVAIPSIQSPADRRTDGVFWLIAKSQCGSS